MPRYDVEVILGILYDGEYLDSIEDMIREIKQRLEKETLERIQLRTTTQRGYYDDVTVTTQIIGYRPETDEEMELRERAQAEREAKNKSYLVQQVRQNLTKGEKRKLYEELKSQFDKG